MRRMATRRRWACAVMWAIAAFIVGQASALRTTIRHEDLLDRADPFIRLTAEGASLEEQRGVFTVPLPVRRDGTKLAVALDVDEQPLKRLTASVSCYQCFQVAQHLQRRVLAVLLTPACGERPTDDDMHAMDQFILGKGDFPVQFGAALLPVAQTLSRDLLPPSSPYYVDVNYFLWASPVVALPAADAPHFSNLKSYKRAWKAHMGTDSIVPRMWSSATEHARHWLWPKTAQNQRVPRSVRGSVNQPTASPLREPVLFAGSENLMRNASETSYSASLLLWTPEDFDDDFQWTRWANVLIPDRRRTKRAYRAFIHIEPYEPIVTTLQLQPLSSDMLREIREQHWQEYNEELTCPVCIESISADNAAPPGTPMHAGSGYGLSSATAIQTPCGHTFHVGCIHRHTRAMRERGSRDITCPICRQSLVESAEAARPGG